jgi:hypothetical protein
MRFRKHSIKKIIRIRIVTCGDVGNVGDKVDDGEAREVSHEKSDAFNRNF